MSMMGGWYVYTIDEGREPFLALPTGLDDVDSTEAGEVAFSPCVGDVGAVAEV